MSTNADKIKTNENSDDAQEQDSSNVKKESIEPSSDYDDVILAPILLKGEKPSFSRHHKKRKIKSLDALADPSEWEISDEDKMKLKQQLLDSDSNIENDPRFKELFGSERVDSLKTEAQLKYDAEMKKKEEDRIAKKALKSHRELIAQFNAGLEKLPEHFDIPKVGPG
ncbi:putative protein FAM32A [Monocercomonoides exilis]|uniref:putative protein FAM32A n=1 Tax=Monocercomonoides exilis TaxID=2049356 RepID=UPI00355996D3|nr:putative protein FAM32A [Monocercomonoides exilis]|eukprot:MONOS_1604.1-p1 / transcript=MONOS_1604.1 / gene=MONOS_1604 / organism=Monocercomonoides_exilis_PA203 / gene_product=unspecified product / transcript_product=unspecified product / location=Mono_scaffold00029:43691-44306(-) / protein_length=167 / sequence_SO=supercontig / SO=protein_coding / is_pseudo=false